MTILERVARAIALARGNTQEYVDDMWAVYIPEAQAAIDSMHQWQPIETAPKDGTRMLLRSPKGRIADGEWGNYGVWTWPYVMVEPTHWMPLL